MIPVPMIPVKETSPGVFERLSGNPVLVRLDGQAKCGLRAMLKPHWTDAERAAYGVHLVEPAKVPEGKRAVGAPTYEKRGDGKVVEVRTVEDEPGPKQDTRTPEQKVEALAQWFGLTVEELRTVLVGGRQ